MLWSARTFLTHTVARVAIATSQCLTEDMIGHAGNSARSQGLLNSAPADFSIAIDRKPPVWGSFLTSAPSLTTLISDPQHEITYSQY